MLDKRIEIKQPKKCSIKIYRDTNQLGVFWAAECYCGWEYMYWTKLEAIKQSEKHLMLMDLTNPFLEEERTVSRLSQVMNQGGMDMRAIDAEELKKRGNK